MSDSKGQPSRFPHVVSVLDGTVRVRPLFIDIEPDDGSSSAGWLAHRLGELPEGARVRLTIEQLPDEML